MRLAIVGCGLIGRKRLQALGPADQVIVAADTVRERAEALAREAAGCDVAVDWRPVVRRPDVEAVIVATTNQWLAPITLAAVEAGKHVLVEKPCARNSEELKPVLAAARDAGVIVQAGFNHRYHPAFQKAREIVMSASIGPLMFVRGRYGHGGRLGYEREWRAQPDISGGGELLDQGVHLIDLAGWFLGPFASVLGHSGTYYWDMKVEDNGFMLLRTASGQVAFLHASCTEWKNLFSFEIYGRSGKLHIEGLGGSYGVERLAYYQMLPEMGPPDTTIWEYPAGDSSWRREFAAFRECIESGMPPEAGIPEAMAALLVVESIYRESKA